MQKVPIVKSFLIFCANIEWILGWVGLALELGEGTDGGRGTEEAENGIAFRLRKQYETAITRSNRASHKRVNRTS